MTKRIFQAICLVAAAVLVCSTAVLLALLLCVQLISQALIEKVDTYVRLDGIRFAQADYEYNIFDDVLYNAKEHDIYYSEYGSGELIENGAYEQYGDQAVFFRKYFDCVINGRYDEYPKLFTDDFFKKNGCSTETSAL